MKYSGIEHIPYDKRCERLKSLPESKLWPIIMLVLRKLDFNWVNITHGTDEHGRDLVGSSKTSTGGTELVGFVVKSEQISGGVSGKTTLINVLDQVKLAFASKYQGPNVRNPESINRIIVVTNKNISSTAKTEISTIDIPHGSIEFWDILELENMVTKYYPSFYIDIDPKLYEYLIALREECQNVNDIQKRIHHAKKTKLTDIFVPIPILEVKRKKAIEVRGQKEKKKDKNKVFEDDEDLHLIKSNELLNPKKDFVIVGGPGSGKSCLLRETCIHVIQKRLGGDTTLPIPLFINARDLESKTDEINLDNLLNKVFCSDKYNDIYMESNNFEVNHTLFVDGLDELSSDEIRTDIYDFLLKLVSENEKAHIIVASRPLNMWRQGARGDIQEGTILPIPRSAMADLLNKLITKPQKSADILRELTNSEMFHKLPRTPLVITLIALLHDEEELPELPANLSDLYELFCMVYLERWSNKGQKNFHLKISILELIAFYLHQARDVQISLSTIITITEKFIKEKGSDEIAEKIVTDLVKENMLLLCHTESEEASNNYPCESGNGDSYCSGNCTISFIHKSFQEFFVARHLKKRPTNGEEFLADNFDDPWWGSIGMFFTGFVKDVPTLIKKIIDKPSPTGPSAISRMVNLGQLTQAALDTDLDIRVASCLHGGELLEDGYKHGIFISKEFDVKLSKYQLVAALSLLYEEAYSSYHLIPSLKKALKINIDNFNNSKKPSFEREILGLQLLGQSWALSNVGHIDSLLEVSKFIDESDGALSALLTIILENCEDYLLSGNGLSDDIISRKNEWLQSIKKVKKRAKRYKDILVKDMNKEARKIGKIEES